MTFCNKVKSSANLFSPSQLNFSKISEQQQLRFWDLELFL